MERLFWLNVTAAISMLFILVTVYGAEAEGTSNSNNLNSNVINVGAEGVVVTSYKSSNVRGAWIEKQMDGYTTVYQKFYQLESLVGFIINNEGEYRIYPVLEEEGISGYIKVIYNKQK